MKNLEFIKNLSKKALICLIIATLSIISISCSKSEVDPVTGEKKTYEPNLNKRIERDKESVVLFGGSKNQDSFTNTNILWRASLSTLKNIPLSSASYNAGMIITDWYSLNNSTEDESIKITINIISKEVSINSIEVNGYKKTCKNNKCYTTSTSQNFNDQIKSEIMNKVRDLNILEKKKKS